MKEAIWVCMSSKSRKFVRFGDIDLRELTIAVENR